MAVFDFFKPKWKSKNPEMRLGAVRAMDGAELAILEALARGDEDVRVRLAAVERISDRETLDHLAGASLPWPVLQAVRAKIDLFLFQSVLGASDSSDAETTVERIEDPALLERLAAEAPSPVLRVKAVERVAEPRALCRILERNCGKDPARAALAKIDDEDLLARLARSGASKVTRRLAEGKLAALVAEREEPARRAIREREIEGLVGTAEDLAEVRDGAAVGGGLPSLRLAWDRLDPDHSHPRWPTFLAAAGRIEEQREVALRRQEEERRQARSEAETLRAAEEVLVVIEGLVGSLDDDAERRFEEAEANWATLGGGAVSPVHAERFERARRSYRAGREAVEEERQRFRALVGELERAEALLGAEDLEGAAAAVAEVDRCIRERSSRSVDSSGLRTRLSAAQRSCEERLAARAEAETMARREELCAELERLVEAEGRAAAGRRVRELSRSWKSLPSLPCAGTRALEERFRVAEERFAARQEVFHQQQEWLRWNNKTLKDGLCAEAEGLDAEEDLEALAQKVKELQRRWKEVGPVPKADADALWNRFKTACDRSFERCSPHLEELKRRRADTLERKEELCREAEAHVDSTDWKESAQALKKLQAQWKEAGPLPRAREEKLYARFRQACDRFFEGRQAHFGELDEKRRASQAEKERLCERAEALAAEPERKHTREFRELQAEWKRVGAAPREAEQALWERFRGACDRFFAWLDEERLENLRRKESLCEEIEALLAAVRRERERREIAAAIVDLQDRWRKIGPVPTDRAEALWDRFRASCEAFFATAPEQPGPGEAVRAPEGGAIDHRGRSGEFARVVAPGADEETEKAAEHSPGAHAES